MSFFTRIPTKPKPTLAQLRASLLSSAQPFISVQIAKLPSGSHVIAITPNVYDKYEWKTNDITILWGDKNGRYFNLFIHPDGRVKEMEEIVKRPSVEIKSEAPAEIGNFTEY